MSQPQLTQEALAREAAYLKTCGFNVRIVSKAAIVRVWAMLKFARTATTAFESLLKNDCHLSRQQQKNGMPIW